GQWIYDLGDFTKATYQNTDLNTGCEVSDIDDRLSRVGTMIHPNGVKGTFTVATTLQGRTHVPFYTDGGNIIYSRCNTVFSLQKKVLTGPGISSLVWQYAYSQNKGAYVSGHGDMSSAEGITGNLPDNITGSATDYKTTKVIAPDGSVSVHYINRDYSSYFEGQEFATQYYDTDGTTLQKSLLNSYTVGTGVGFAELERENVKPIRYRAALATQVVAMSTPSGQESRYTTAYGDYDVYGNARKITQSNSFSAQTRYHKKTFYNDTTNWLIGLPASHAVSSNDSDYTTTQATTYYGATSSYPSQVNYHYRFGRWITRYDSYYTSGTQSGLPNKVQLNGANRWVRYANYYRGIARAVSTPQSESTTTQTTTKQVDSNGWVTQQTDFEGHCVNFAHDSLGRVVRIDPCNSAWADTLIDYTTTGGSEGYPNVTAGMLKQTVTHGAQQKQTYYDGLHRAIFVVNEDVTNSATARFQRMQYDGYNRLIFNSHPSTSASTPYGTKTYYDGIGRIIHVNDTAVSGATSYQYLTQNRTRVTDNKGNVTTTRYLSYGSPSQSQATTIQSPEGVTTELTYNVFDQLTRVSQGGLTEYRVYDGYQQLCKTVRADVGNTAYHYGAAGQLLWQARGDSVSNNTSSCDGSVSTVDKVDMSYGNRGQLLRVDYGDGTPSKTYHYDKNGLITELTFGTVTQSYTYNDLGLVTQETLAVDGHSFTLSHHYNNLGYLSSETYPSGATLNYAPNALGQPTRVGSYATQASYFANGMIKRHNYGNGFVHVATQNARGLPATWYDLRNGQYALNYGLHYDANNNVTFWDDKLSNAYDMQASYDGLDRLATITDSYLGSGSLSYDAMGNITRYQLGTQVLNYSYGSTKRLNSVSGASSYVFGYDDLGNVVDNGQMSFSYNAAQQMLSAGSAQYDYDGNDKRVKVNDSEGVSYSFYSQSGRLVYRLQGSTDIDYYYLGDKLIAKRSGSTVRYFHSDYLGSTAATSNASGTILSRQHYQPFG
ncbi:hypothetical protein DFP83_1251, partial [Idiomarina fontislapidosi]